MKTLNAENTALLMVDGMFKAMGPDMAMGGIVVGKRV